MWQIFSKSGLTFYHGQPLWGHLKVTQPQFDFIWKTVRDIFFFHSIGELHPLAPSDSSFIVLHLSIVLPTHQLLGFPVVSTINTIHSRFRF